MITTILLVVFAVVAMLVLVGAVRRHYEPVPDLLALEEHTRPVDLAAFRNLVDPGEEDYLRQRLPADVFRSIQRQRIRAALDYVRRTAYNGAILLRVGESARHDHNPEVAAAARELVTNAVRLRLNAKLATLVLYGRIVMPDARIPVSRVTEAYEHLTQDLVRLARLQTPGSVTRVSAAV